MGSAFRRFWVAAVCSNLADGFYLVALPLLALELTSSPGLVAGVTVAVRVPWLLLALLAGVAADRWRRQPLLGGVTAVRGLALALLAVAVVADAASIWLLYLVALVLGACETLGDTTAQSALPAFVPPADLDRANGWLESANLVGGLFVAPPIAGALAAVSLALASGTAAGLYALAAIGIMLVAADMGPKAAPATRPGLRREIAEGLSFLRHHPYLRPMAVTVFGMNTALGAFFAILPVHAVSPGPLALSEGGFGLLLGGLGAGAVLAVLALTRLPAERLGVGAMTACGAVMAVALTVPALVEEPAVTFAGLLAFGAALTLFNVRTLSIRQRLVPDSIIGRVNASYRLCAYGALPIGAALAGALAERFSVPVVFPLAAATVAATLPNVRRAFRALPRLTQQGSP